MEEMNPPNGRRSEEKTDGDARDYLMNLRCLSSELRRAMEAIISRELSTLQDSLHVQRFRCARLSDLRQSAKVRRLLKSELDGSECDLSAEIRAATERLLALNQQYSALLSHSGETLRLLAGLYGGYPVCQGHSRAALFEPGRPGWHCEI